MPDAMFAMPTWLAGLGLMGFLGALSFAGLAAARRWILPRMRIQTDDSQFSCAITQSVMVFYGLVAALVAVSVWQKFGQVSDLWLIIVAGALVSVTSTFFYQVESFRLHATMVVLLAVFIALVIFVIFALDRPFGGDLAITAESYQLIYDQLMKP